MQRKNKRRFYYLAFLDVTSLASAAWAAFVAWFTCVYSVRFYIFWILKTNLKVS